MWHGDRLDGVHLAEGVGRYTGRGDDGHLAEGVGRYTGGGTGRRREAGLPSLWYREVQ